MTSSAVCRPSGYGYIVVDHQDVESKGGVLIGRFADDQEGFIREGAAAVAALETARWRGVLMLSHQGIDHVAIRCDAAASQTSVFWENDMNAAGWGELVLERAHS